MANFPGPNYSIPGVYGPSSTEIIKDGDTYTIGWFPIKSCGNPHFSGTIKEMARDIILRQSTSLGLPGRDMFDVNKIPFYGSIHVEWNNPIVCTLSSRVETIGFNPITFLKEISEELNKLSHLIPFM